MIIVTAKFTVFFWSGYIIKFIHAEYLQDTNQEFLLEQKN